MMNLLTPSGQEAIEHLISKYSQAAAFKAALQNAYDVGECAWITCTRHVWCCKADDNCVVFPFCQNHLSYGRELATKKEKSNKRKLSSVDSETMKEYERLQDELHVAAHNLHAFIGEKKVDAIIREADSRDAPPQAIQAANDMSAVKILNNRGVVYPGEVTVYVFDPPVASSSMETAHLCDIIEYYADEAA